MAQTIAVMMYTYCSSLPIPLPTQRCPASQSVSLFTISFGSLSFITSHHFKNNATPLTFWLMQVVSRHIRLVLDCDNICGYSLQIWTRALNRAWLTTSLCKSWTGVLEIGIRGHISVCPTIQFKLHVALDVAYTFVDLAFSLIYL